MILRKGKEEIRGKVSKNSEIKWNERRDETRRDEMRSSNQKLKRQLLYSMRYAGDRGGHLSSPNYSVRSCTTKVHPEN
jgi:hypothetical protein